MAADTRPGSKPPSRISQLARREGELRDLGDRVRSTPAAGAGPELSARRDDLLRRIDEQHGRVTRELEDRRALAKMGEEGKRLVEESRDPSTSPRRKAELEGKIGKAKKDFAAKKEELKEKYGSQDAPKGSPDAEDPCVPCLEKDAEALEAETSEETEKKLELARGLCDAEGSADAADAELVAQELAKMPREDLERMEANGTRVAVCRGSVTDCRPGLAGDPPRGWPEGTDWSKVPGCYDDSTNRVVVATRGHGTERGAHVPDTGDGHGSANLAIHEAYHGLDYKSGKPSSGADFTSVRAAAPGELSDYMSQSGQAGEEESFAESAARRFGCPPDVVPEQPRLDDYWRTNPLGRAGGGGTR